MTEYQSLESRIFHSYLLQSAPSFIPDNRSNASEQEQKDLYDFTKNLYAVITESPKLLMKNLNADDAHPGRFNCASYGKPELKINMRKALKAMNELLDTINQLCLEGVVSIDGTSILLQQEYKVPKKYMQVFSAIGLEIDGNQISCRQNPGLFLARKGLEARGHEPMQRFIRCMYDDSQEYMIDLFREYAGDTAAYDRLIAWLRKQGYYYVDFLNNSEVRSYESCGMGLAKKIVKEDVPEGSMYDKNHIGLYMDYNSLLQKPVAFSLRLQQVRELLPKFDTFEDTLKKFMVNYHAKCNGCLYCIQRQKAKNPNAKIFAIPVEYEGKNYSLCPINFVYTYGWNQLNEEIVDGIMAFLETMEKEGITTP